MRKLLQVLQKYYLFFLFLFLELAGFLMLVRYNTYHQISYLSWLNEVTGGINEKYSNATDYLSLEQQLVALSNENAGLRKQLQESYLNTESNFNPYADTVYDQNFIYRTAKVIDNSLSKQDNYLMIDKGTLAGVTVGMGVINPSGIIGIVTDVSPHYAVIMSVLNSNFQLGVRLKNSNYFGVLNWNGKDPKLATLNNIQQFVTVNESDTIQTLGASGIFPEGLMVGTVETLVAIEETNSWELEVFLSAEIQQAKYVYVVENLFVEEIIELEEDKE